MTGKSEQVREMFAEIAPKYDAANEILSLKVYHSWYKKVIKESSLKDDTKLLDCATGTGNLAIAFKKYGNFLCDVTGVDYCKPMLDIGVEKAKRENLDIKFEIADVMELPYEDNYFDLATISFGIRNVSDISRGINEMARVVKPMGKVIILEFGMPKSFFRYIYSFWQKKIIPFFGKLITGSNYAYDYLAITSSEFPCREDFITIMEGTGKFSHCAFKSLSGGIAYLYVGNVI